MTRLHIVVQGVQMTLDVKDTYEEALEKVFPLQPPVSTLEQRAKMQWIAEHDDCPAAIAPSVIFMVEARPGPSGI